MSPELSKNNMIVTLMETLAEKGVCSKKTKHKCA